MVEVSGTCAPLRRSPGSTARTDQSLCPQEPPVTARPHHTMLDVQLRGPWDGIPGLTCAGITGAMLVAGAGDAAGVGTPTRYLSFVSQGTEFTELACVSLGT